MSELLEIIAQHPQDATALVGHGKTWSYEALNRAIVQFSAFLQLFPNETIALLAANSPAWIVTDLACVRMGTVLVPIPPFFSVQQIEHALRDAGVTLILTDQPQRFEGQGMSIEILGTTYHALMRDAASVAMPEGTQKITYTSGTTGRAKGVCLSQDGMERVAQSLVSRIGAESGARHACLLPLAVLLENVAGVYTALLAGGTVFLDPVAHTPAAITDYLVHTKATSCIFVPELLRMVLASRASLPHLRFAAVGGARVAPALLHAAALRQLPVYEGYGLSECASVVALNTPDQNHPGSVGTVLPHMQLRIAEDGEIILGQALFLGYLGQATWHGGDEYPTGDIGHLDAEGHLFIDGRKKHMFITSFGRNISPEWPESLLAAQPGVLQACVFGEAMAQPVAVLVASNPQEAAMAVAAVNAGLPDYARIGDFILATESFSPGNQQLTGNGRPRRDAIWQYYSASFSQPCTA